MEQHLLDTWLEKRNTKLQAMLNPDDPAWLVREVVDEPSEMMSFDVVHRWSSEGWAVRRYTYDMVADVLHFRGTSPVNDADISKMKPEQRILY